MKATETKFLDFLKGPKQFIIPIYQRTYSWTLKQCEQLWKDIVRAATDDSVAGHFVGSIVYIEKGLYQISSIPQLLVIDGQQRLTTISLILAALGQAIASQEDAGDLSQKKIKNYFLLNSEEEDDWRYKLLLTQSDKPTLMRLVDGNELPDQSAKRIVDNYEFFKDRIAKIDFDLPTLYRGLAKLIVVDISLSREHDNPQLIFESLNSTGLKLSQADLIRNYILMGLEPKQQDKLYSDYWFQMEQSFGQADYAVYFDRFMRDYLTIKTGRIPNIYEVYEEFKAYSQKATSGSIAEIVEDIYRYSKYFASMALGLEKDESLRRLFDDINSLKVDVAYPFLLEAYDDYKNDHLTHSDFMTLLSLISSYVFRRAICGIPTNSMNKTLATLGREIKKDYYLESFMAALIVKDSYRRFPTDEEFASELVVKDLYNFRNRNYWLRKMENFDRKEPVSVEEYTIEHIMPQNKDLSPEWQAALGENWSEIHSRYLHTLGNLTLTGYNSELSDRKFTEKRDMKGGFADSPIRLNHDLAKLEQWNESEIQKRADTLAKMAQRVWPYPPLSAEAVQTYRRETKAKVSSNSYTLNDYIYLEGPMLELFEQFRKRVLNLDSSVHEEMLKFYIAYKTTTNFVDVVPQKSRLRLSLNMGFDEINDPKGLCKDVSDRGRWGNGDVEIGLSSATQLDDVMALVRQSFDKHMDSDEL